MSDEVNSQAQGAQGTEELDPVRLAATNKRLLEESVQWKEKYKSLAHQQEELERKRLEESGTLEERLKAETKRAAELQAALDRTTKQVVTQKVKEKVLRFAGDVHNPDDLIANPKLKEYLAKGLDEENLDFNDEVAKQYVEDLKKEKPYFWKQSGPIGANTGKPAANIPSSKPVELKKDDLKSFIINNFK